jgi:hypothetical protein
LLQILRLSCILRRGCGRVGGAAIYVRTLGTELEEGEPLPKKMLETGRQAAKERDIYFEWELSFLFWWAGYLTCSAAAPYSGQTDTGRGSIIE